MSCHLGCRRRFDLPSKYAKLTWIKDCFLYTYKSHVFMSQSCHTASAKVAVAKVAKTATAAHRYRHGMRKKTKNTHLQSGTAVPLVRTWHDLTKYQEWKKAPAFWTSDSKRDKWQRVWPGGQVNMFRDLGMFELEWICKVTKLGTFMENRTCFEVILCSIPNLPHLINQCVVRADFLWIKCVHTNYIHPILPM